MTNAGLELLHRLANATDFTLRCRCSIQWAVMQQGATVIAVASAV